VTDDITDGHGNWWERYERVDFSLHITRQLRLECSCTNTTCITCAAADELEQLNTIHGWLQHGINNGYCQPPTCGAHDGTPYSEEEADAYEAGEDPCIYIVKLIEP